MNVKKTNFVSNYGKNSHTPPTGIGVYGDELLDAKDLGTETEAEKQMKLLLKKQLKTDMTLKEHLAERREFKKSNTYTSMTELIRGSCSLEKYRAIEKAEEQKVQLQQSGLSEEEIKLYMRHMTEREGNTLSKLEPSVLNTRLQELKNKITSHQQQLKTSATCSGAKVLSRHAMDIEKTLYVGCKQKRQLDCLITPESHTDLNDDDPFKHVKEASERLTQNAWKKRKQRKMEKSKKGDVESSLQTSEDFVYNPSIHHVVVPLEEREMSTKRLTEAEIRKIPRFENYDPGSPNKVLYLKNLHSKITVRDLQTLFGSFDSESEEGIDYKILSGGMRGQAFLTFQDTETASKAMNHANGFSLRGRPVIISYGKKKT